MNELEMCKAFAELEGVEVEVSDMLGTITIGKDGYEVYNPIQDLALNCKARDDYEVQIDYLHNKTSVFKFDGRWLVRTVWDLGFNSKEDIPRAVIECILKSKGLWHE